MKAINEEEQLTPEIMKGGLLTWQKRVVLCLLLFSLFMGVILGIVHNAWAEYLLLGTAACILYGVAAHFFSKSQGYKYLVSGIFSFLSIMLMVQAEGNIAIHAFTLMYLIALISFGNWKVFIPFTVLTALAITGLGYLQHHGFPYVLVENRESLSAGYLLLYVSLIIANATLAALLAELFHRVFALYISTGSRLSQLRDFRERNHEYAKQIANGNYEASYPLQEGDVLGQSLTEMSQSLKKASLEEKQRSWSMLGTTKIGEILRLHQDNPDELAYNAICQLAKFIKANQGAMFILNDEEKDDPFLELRACYAYERKKYLEKKILPGQGLVGQAYLEKDLIYMTQLPDRYITITSGLGEATPTSIVVVPLGIEDQVVGVMEFAFFHELEDFQIDFLKKVSENIASSVVSSKNRDMMKKLLEESMSATEVLKEQEEEMRQNMEEMQALQENLKRESEEKEKMQQEVAKARDFFQLVINAIPDPIFVKKGDGHRFIMVNSAWERDYAGGRDVIGQNDFDLFPEDLARKFYEDEEKLFKARTELDVQEKGIRQGMEIFNLTKKRVFDNEEGEMFLVGINHDITALVQKAKKD